jgi:hypothetical protein
MISGFLAITFLGGILAALFYLSRQIIGANFPRW